MAAILRDPNPIHFDPATRDDGEPNLRINQGPLNVGYIANMLTNWAGPGSIKRLRKYLLFRNPILIKQPNWFPG